MPLRQRKNPTPTTGTAVQTPPPVVETGTRISIDPITRIEGHLKIEVKIENGQVTDAWSSGTLFRGIEIILQGREPEDAWLFTQRLCGVCTYVHGASSVRAVEDATDLTIPANARIVRNLLMGGQYVHDHPVHFYHLHALDWVDIVSALSADPYATQALAVKISTQAESLDFASIQDKLKTFVDSGQLGPFSGGYWGHPAYTLLPEENLLFASHYLYALEKQLQAAKMHALFGAKNPHLQSLRAGGVTCRHDITGNSILRFRGLLNEMREFIDTIYIPDVIYLAKQYPGWGQIGGFSHYLTYGDFQLGNDEPADLFLPRGIIKNRDITRVAEVDLNLITEHVQHSFYKGEALPPARGATQPDFTGYDTADRYSWLKAPRYDGLPMEVGPLARMLVAYGKGMQQVVDLVGHVLGETGLPPSALHSVLGRVAARAIETKVIADAMNGWLSQLMIGAPTFIEPAIPSRASGVGLNEAPRGALGHWLQIEDHKIGNYQMVVPSTWNCGPRCSAEKPGPLEEALIGTPVSDPGKPVEVLRIVHSYDPCLACAVHIIDLENDQVYKVRAI